MKSKVALTPEPSPVPQAVLLVVLAAAGAFGIYRVFLAPAAGPRPVPAQQQAASAASSAAAPAAPVTRCVEVGGEGFVVGEPPAPRAKPKAADQGDEPPEEEASPFAVSIGKGTVFDKGFAAGALRQDDGGTAAMIATIGFDGRRGELVRLARSRGDLEPPAVTGAGGSVLVAMLEPNAGGRAIKLAKVTGNEVTWGAEFTEGKDESLAVDLAASGSRAVVAWDDMVGNDRYSVMLASFDVATMKSVTAPRPVSSEKNDADSPRLLAREGGYWLAYLAKTEPPTDVEKKRAKNADSEDEDDPRARAGEAIGNRWVEVLPLDANGAPAAPPRAVTAKTGHVLTFDLAPASDGVFVVYRDDDTPSGSSGGGLGSVVVKLGGAIEARPIQDQAKGVGVPSLVPGWLVMSGLAGRTYLAALGPGGELLEALEPEPVLASGEVVAATRDVMLVARPFGRAMRLIPVRCSAKPASTP
jgi:hypothetical protein